MKPSLAARLVALVALALGPAACGAAPPADRATTLVQAEGVVGTVLAALYEPASSPYEQGMLTQYVQDVGMRVAKAAGLSGRTWEFVVLDDRDVNAYALLGGHVYVTRGMLAVLDSEAELAAVLAHEIGHVAAGHGLNTVSDLEAGARTADPEEAARGRDKENQADQLAIRYLVAAGYDSTAFGRMLRAILAWRPGERDRSWDPARIAHAALVAGRAPRGEEARERYLGFIYGLVLDEDPRYGRVEGGRFIHEAAGFSMIIPSGMVAVVSDHDLLAVDVAVGTGLVVKPATRLVVETMVDLLKKESAAQTYSYPGLTIVLGEVESVWTAVMTAGEEPALHRLIFKAIATDAAKSRAVLFTAMGTLRSITPEERRLPRRLRIGRVEREGLLGDVLGTACGGAANADLAMSLELHGPGAVQRILQQGESVKCAPPAAPDP